MKTNIFGCGDENDLLNFAWKDSHADNYISDEGLFPPHI